MSIAFAKRCQELRFDAVEVVGLNDDGIGFAKHGDDDAVTWTRALGEPERLRLRGLLGALPDGVSARCHMPGFGLRITSDGDVQRVSICFECSNAYVNDELTSFEPSSGSGQELLTFLQSLGPRP